MWKVSLELNALNPINRVKLMTIYVWSPTNEKNSGFLGKDGNMDVVTYYASFTHFSKEGTTRFIFKGLYPQRLGAQGKRLWKP